MPLPQIEGHVEEYIETPENKLRERVTELENRVNDLEFSLSGIKRDAVVALLKTLGESLHHVASGKFDLDATVAMTAVAAPQFDPKWEVWKQKLGPSTAPARVIEAILGHGPLTRTQLRAAGELGWSTLDKATSRLNNLGLIEKVGDKWNLKS
jgi:DNA-binding transcriptional ArsR family regulator